MTEDIKTPASADEKENKASVSDDKKENVEIKTYDKTPSEKEKESASSLREVFSKKFAEQEAKIREYERKEAELEKKRLEDEGKYKELLEKEREEKLSLEKSYRISEAKAQLGENAHLVKYAKGDTVEEIVASVNELVEAVGGKIEAKKNEEIEQLKAKVPTPASGAIGGTPMQAGKLTFDSLYQHYTNKNK